MPDIKNIFLAVILMLAGFGCEIKKPNTISPGEISIIPRPADLQVTRGHFQVKPGITIFYSNKDLSFISGYLKDKLENLTGFVADTIYSKNQEIKGGSILLSTDEKMDHPEGYELTIGKNINIKAKNPVGVLYGVQSLYQLIFSCQSNDFVIPGLIINDYPRFSWRGMHLDVSRHFFDKKFVKKYIDILALHKMNVFHWHLVDDQGWRIEMKKYPKLTRIGAWRVDRENLPWNERPPQGPGEEAGYGGFYTQEEIKEIVEYAAQRHIEIVPEIEMPAHVSSAIAAYPEYSCKELPITVPPGGVWPITDIYCAGNDEAFEFLEDVLTEVMNLFPSEFIHIGGDEATRTEWKKCRKCQARIKLEGLKNERELQSYFIRRIDKFLVKNGRRLIGWDEILEGGLAENAAVMSWRGEQGGIEAAEMHHDVVMTPGSHCYFDHYQSLDKDIEPKAFGGFTDLAKVYDYEPIPGELDSITAKHVLGAQGNVWTEFMTTGEHVEYMVIPRMTALSEVLWTSKENKDFDDFKKHLENFLNVLAFNGINYYVPPPENLLPEMIFADSLSISLERPLPFGKIYYTVDGTEPTDKSTEYTGPVVASKDGIIKSVFVLENARMSKIKSGALRKEDPLKSIAMKGNTAGGLSYKYFEGVISTLTNFDELIYKNSGVIEKIRLPELPNKDAFGLEIEGLVKIPQTGVYTFKLISDDGSQLLIDDRLVVDADGLHGPEPKSGQVVLEEGFHKILVKYFEAGGGEILEGYIQGPGLEDQLMTVDFLYHSEGLPN